MCLTRILDRPIVVTVESVEKHPGYAEAIFCSGARVLARRYLNAFATLAFDEVMSVLAIGVDRFARPLARPFVATADLAVRAVDPALTFTESPWRSRRRSNSVLLVAERAR